MKEKKIYPKWNGEVKGLKVELENPEGFKTHLIPYEGKRVTLIVKLFSKFKSRKEEKYYHAVVVPAVAEAMSITDQEAHEFLKSLHLTVEERSANGNFRYKRTQSTTELNDRAYRGYWNKCVNWAALPNNGELSQSSGLSLYIPMPNEVDFANY